MINFKRFYKRLVFDADSVMLEKYMVTQNDTKSRGFYVEIYQNGRIVEVSEGNKLTFYGRKPDGKSVFVDAVVEEGFFRVDLPNQTFTIPGEIKAELTLRGAEDEILTKKILIQVIPSFIDSEPIESEDDFTALQQALAEIAEFAGKIEDVKLYSENLSKEIGDLSELSTENKESLVKAINEVDRTIETLVTSDSLIEMLEEYAKISTVGELSELNTEDKSNIVNSINEILEEISKIELENDNDHLMSLILLKADKKDLGEVKDIKELGDEKARNVVEAINYLIDVVEILTSEINKINFEDLAKKEDLGDLSYLETEIKSDIVSALNELNGKVKDVEAVTNAEELALMLSSKADRRDLGQLKDLKTASKANAVSAINEVYDIAKNIESQEGPKGEDGADGQDGKSAYQIWLDEGNEGTEQDFLDRLKGPPGPKGDNGSDATVTKESIINALGYKPADEAIIIEIDNKLDIIIG